MSSQRAAGQKLINIPIDEKALAEIDSAAKALGYPDRAKFIRDAIYEKLEREGFSVPKEYFFAPSRIGKGGRPSKRKRPKEQS